MTGATMTVHTYGIFMRKETARFRSSRRFSGALDLPFQADAARLEHAAADFLSEILDIGGAGRAAIDQKIAMQL